MAVVAVLDFVQFALPLGTQQLVSYVDQAVH